MKKGVWIANLVSAMLRGDISFSDGVSFGSARVRAKPVSFSLREIKFESVDHIFWSIIADVFINRVYLPKNFNIRPTDVVIDIGAHRGAFTSFAAQRTSNTVVAYEPNPMNFVLLQELTRANNFHNVIAHNAAVGSRSGRSTLFISGSSSRHSLYRDFDAERNPVEQIDVTVLSLDECLAELEVVHLLKMDCEGAEFEIIMNAEPKTLSKIQKLVMETHDPLHSPKMDALCAHINRFFPNNKLVDQGKENLGYLYAWKADL